jgi:thiosulfate/3-mercaptopyruvate sulfurtransferase
MNVLVSAAELAELMDRATVLDVRWDLRAGPDREAYETWHIPGAVFVDLDAELAAPAGAGGRHPLPGAEAFTASMRRAGLSAGRPVVAYDAATGIAAARAWWLLRHFGHPEVAVLDGGFAAWIAAGGAVEIDTPRPASGDFTARPGGMPLIDADGAADVARRGVLLDARAPERFRGEQEPIDPVAGHIPGAVNRPTTFNVDEDGRFRDASVLRAEFEELGVHEGARLGAYCGSGVTATHEVLALELAGFQAALYAGSWSEWIRQADRPLATGGGSAGKVGTHGGPRSDLPHSPT